MNWEETLPMMLAAAMRPGIKPEWLRALVENGLSHGLPMQAIYEQTRERAARLRGVQVPSYEELMKPSRD